ncbi:urease accessory protein UreD [Oricola thermophila]|uniref:Urease accessory protein UreD n=1 Tax=Oricola thermophila TaxID=2742145 RepID=A0A6N1VMU1_9HYPH|nr:urease accessory protein UreD [Oricola thermophila]QKV20307.1 urease accessory protein UreD [Oricola thermophila]
MTGIAATHMQRSHGKGTLAVKRAAGRTRIDRLHQSGNAKIRVPGTHTDALEAVLINTSGGVTGGDTLSWTIESGPGTNAIISTQACERIYRSAGDTGRQNTAIRVESGATLFWLPQETILFDGGRFVRALEVDLADDARFVGLETLILGREAMGETVASGLYRDRWRIRRAGALVHAEDFRIDPEGEPCVTAAAVLGGNRVAATLVVATGDDAERLDLAVAKARDLLDGTAAGISRIGEGAGGRIVVRAAAPTSHALRKRLLPLLSLFLDGRPLPRTWSL